MQCLASRKVTIKDTICFFFILHFLHQRHVAEMEEMVGWVGTSKTDDDVNQLTTKQLEESQVGNPS